MFANLSFCTAILGLFLSFPLFALARKRPANFWLAYFVFQFAWLALADVFLHSPYAIEYPNGIAVFHWAVAGLGAAYYCYVRSLTGLGNGWRQIVHFIPQIYLIGLLVWYTLISPATQSIDKYADCQPCRIGPQLLVFQLLAFAYLPLVLVRLYQFRKQVALQYSSTAGRDLTWLQVVTIALLILLCLWLPLNIQGGYGRHLLAISRLLIMILLGWYGLRQQTLFLPESAITSSTLPEVQQELQVDSLQIDEVEVENTDASSAIIKQDTPGEKYARSGMTAAAQSLIAARLENRMGHFKDYLEPDLRLNQLAERIGTSPQLLSQYLNEVVGQSFFDYINSRRVVQVQELMHDPAHADSSLLDLALAAGFNSKTTFNNFFKKSTGVTPSAWRKQR